MSLSYKHILIPDQADYTPHPGRIRDFFRVLSELGATPVDPVLQLTSDAERISWLDGKPVITPVALTETRKHATKVMSGREGRNPATGEMLVVPRRYLTLLSDLEQLPVALDQLDQYEFEMLGKGPAKLSLIDFNPDGAHFASSFEFHWRCCLSRTIISTSDYHGHEPTGQGAQPFGNPVNNTSHTGYFSNPETLETIKVPKGGCARFRVELAFGNRLFPKIRETLDLLHPSILAAANVIFGVNFAQGCWWG